MVRVAALLIVLLSPAVFAWVGGQYDYPARIPDTNLYIGNVYSTDCAMMAAEQITHTVDLFGMGNDDCDGVTRRYYFLYDSETQDIMPTAEAVRVYVSELGPDARVLVHCQAGTSRSAAVLAYILMATYDKPLSEALDVLRSVRDVIDPNPGFMEQLTAYQAWRTFCILETKQTLCHVDVLPWRVLEFLGWIRTDNRYGYRWWYEIMKVDMLDSPACKKSDARMCHELNGALFELGLSVRIALDAAATAKQEL